jgi:hypothetical protein
MLYLKLVTGKGYNMMNSEGDLISDSTLSEFKAKLIVEIN